VTPFFRDAACIRVAATGQRFQPSRRLEAPEQATSHGTDGIDPVSLSPAVLGLWTPNGSCGMTGS